MTSTIGAADVGATSAFDPAANALSKVGHHYRADDYYEVGREKVREFARAVQDFHPLHWHEDTAREYGYPTLLAPPTFLALVTSLAQRKLFDTEVTGYDVSQVMHTDQTYELHRPILVGDRLTSDVYLHSFRQAFGGDLLTTKTIVTDQRGERVATCYTGLVGRSGVADDRMRATVRKVMMYGFEPGQTPQTRGASAPGAVADLAAGFTAEPGRNARGVDSVTPGQPLPGRTVALTLGDLVNYAGASGDPNPIHWSPDVATLVGIEGGVIAHGQFTMALGAGFVTSWLGDPGALLDYSVRFTSPVYVTADEPGVVEYTGKVKSVDPHARTAVVAIVATHRGKKIFGRATATVRLG